MIEGRCRARFLLKAIHSLTILGELSRQKLERYLATEPRVLGQVNLSHPARAEQRENLIGTDFPPQNNLDLILSNPPGYDIQRRRRKEAVRLPMRRQKRLHLSEQFLIIRAGFGEKGFTLGDVALKGGVIQALDLPPSLRLHTNFPWPNLP